MHAFYASIPARAEGCAQCSPLDDFQVVAAAGADAISFLHGQLTQDVAALPQDAARLAGYCTAKGRLLATLLMWRAAPGPDDAPVLYALARADLAPALLKRLSMFVLRAKVKLAAAPLHAAGVQAAPGQLAALETAAGGALPRSPWQRADLPTGTWIAAPAAGERLRWLWIASGEQLDAAHALPGALGLDSAESWRAGDLAAGIPWIGAATQDVFIPQTVNLELIQGVSFTKGCYPGQEVVARSHYRGTIKRRMAYGLVESAPETPAAALAGQDVYDAAQPGEPVGRVVDAARAGAGLSLLFEIALSALHADLRLGAADGPRLSRRDLPYAIEPEAR